MFKVETLASGDAVKVVLCCVANVSVFVGVALTVEHLG